MALGNYTDAALSGLAMIPFAGWAATAGKGAKYASKALNAASDAAKYADEVVDVGKRVFRETGDELAEEILGHGDEAVDAAKGAGDALNKLPKSTAESVTTKLDTYLLEPTHPVGGSKAKWFKEALGFTKENSADLAKQIVFDPQKAIQTAKNTYGTKFSQMISVRGANGKMISVEFVFIKNNDGIIRLVTSIPTK